MNGDAGQREARTSDPPLPVLVGQAKVKKRPNPFLETLGAILFGVPMVSFLTDPPPADGGLNSFSRFGGMVLLPIAFVYLWVNVFLVWRKHLRREPPVAGNERHDEGK